MINIIITSVETAKQAQDITEELLKLRLAACIQQTSGISTYHWQNTLQSSTEYYLHIKTSPKLAPHVCHYLQENHPYDIPEIITLEATASQNYSHWLQSETHQALL